MLDMLKSLGITSEAELIARLGLPETASSEDGSVATLHCGRGNRSRYLAARLTRPRRLLIRKEFAALGLAVPAIDRYVARWRTASTTAGHGGSEHKGLSGGMERGRGKSTSGTGCERSFISYVAVHPDNDESILMV